MGNSLYSYQQKAVDTALQYPSYALFLDTGVGKTMVAIEIMRRRRVSTLIVCPLNIVRDVWEAKIKEWYPEANVINLWKERKDLTDEEWLTLAVNPLNVGIINYESLTKLPLIYIRNIKQLIADESHRLKGPGSLSTQFLIGQPSGKQTATRPGYANFIPHKLILSGTPAPNGPMEYWSQMKMIDPNILGPNFYQFRGTYFYSTGYGGHKWIFREELRGDLMARIKTRAMYLSKEDCLELPEKTFEPRRFELSAPMRQAYKDMLKTNILQLRGTTVIGTTELAKLMKLRQITSGFVIDNEGQVVRMDETKMKAMDEIIESIAPERQVIIWCQFKFEIESIMKRLNAEKWQAVSLYGNMTQNEKQEAIDAFTAGRCRFLVAHPKTGGVGLTFTNCAYNIYYSMSYSYEEFKQSQDRIHRIGQKSNVTYYFLLAEKTIDETLFRVVTKKEDLSTALLEMINGESSISPAQ